LNVECCFLVVLLSVAFSARAETKWTITTANFQSKQLDVSSIDDDGVSVLEKVGQPARVIKWDGLLAIDRAIDAKASGKFTLLLAGGDQIRGEPAKIDGETLTWHAASVGDMQIALKQVLAISKSAQPRGREGEKQAEDVVLLSNGDSVRGIVSSLADKQLTVQVNGTPTPVPLDSVATITFASTGAPPASSTRVFRIRLSDDSLITAQSVKTSGDQLAITLAGAVRNVPLGSVAAIEQMNGPVSWLSSRAPSQNVQTPMLQTSRPARMDRSVTGKPIRFGERSYARGIGVAPYSKITWPLDPSRGYQSFRTQYAIDGASPYADVTVRVLLDDKVAHERKGFGAGELSPVILVPLGGAKTLTLEVDFGANYNVQDRLNWIEPALTRSAPLAPATRP
jgi:hypothetical protein